MRTKQKAASDPSCTAFDHTRHLASGSYLHVALAVRAHVRTHTNASVLIFDDATGRPIDFDLRGSEEEVSARLLRRFPRAQGDGRQPPGRPKIGVLPREVTLLPRHWEWLAEQPGGASAALRRLVEDARRAGLTDKKKLRKLHERAYHFMSGMAGNFPNFEEASRALFANNMSRLKELIADWPPDIGSHVMRLSVDDPSIS
jgi:uncharacterized protein